MKFGLPNFLRLLGIVCLTTIISLPVSATALTIISPECVLQDTRYYLSRDLRDGLRLFGVDTGGSNKFDSMTLVGPKLKTQVWINLEESRTDIGPGFVVEQIAEMTASAENFTFEDVRKSLSVWYDAKIVQVPDDLKKCLRGTI